MDLRKRILTENECYKTGDTIKVEGLMLHSTGANNPKLSRYVDAPELAPVSPNHWNVHRPDGRQVCVHGFIGLTPDNKVATYQTLPWNHRGWGGGGSSNNTHIHVEICEGNLNDKEYFNRVYKEAVELFAYLTAKFKLDADKDIITHSEGHKQGIASNHADVMHWFPKHGKSMDTFRADVKKQLGEVKPEQPKKSEKSVEELAQEVIAGKHGTGDARKKALGANYSAVQKRVNDILGAKKSAPKPQKSIDTLVQEVLDGKHGTGAKRQRSLGRNYVEVQKRVNDILLGKQSKKPAGKSVDQLATEVIKGLHGSGRERQISLGSKYAAVQKEVNRRLLKK